VTSSHEALCSVCKETLALVSEPTCSSCGLMLVSEHDLCMHCRSERPPWSMARTLWWYQGVSAALIKAAKFDGDRRVAVFCAEALSPFLEALVRQAELSKPVICSVPANPRNRWRRGFDLVSDIARRLPFPNQELLARKKGKTQKELDRKGRLTNLAGNIFIRNGSVVPEEVVLVDDVMTTGASFAACTKVLLDGGAKHVSCIALCRD